MRLDSKIEVKDKYLNLEVDTAWHASQNVIITVMHARGDGVFSGYEISVPLEELAHFVDAAREVLR